MTTQERDAWAAAYRLYDEFAPRLRKAATLHDTKLAGELFLLAGDKVSLIYNQMDEAGKLILYAVYDNILGEVFKEAYKAVSE